MTTQPNLSGEPIRTTATLRLDIEVPEGWELVTVSVGPWDDTLVLLRRPAAETSAEWEQRRGKYKRRRGGPESNVEMEASDYRISSRVGRNHSQVEINGVPRYYKECQTIRGGPYLLVQPRVWGDYQNAETYDRHGRLTWTFELDDAINQVQATGDGRVWVAYSDEGVHGHGLGRNGAMCFDSRGGIIFGYNGLARVHGLPSILDCDAINVASDVETWLFYYNLYPLVRVVDGRIVGHWPTLCSDAPIAGADAFAVTGTHALFAGGFHAKESLHLVSLEGKGARVIEAVDERGERIVWTRAFGRGAKLFLVTEAALYEVDAAKIA